MCGIVHNVYTVHYYADAVFFFKWTKWSRSFGQGRLSVVRFLPDTTRLLQPFVHLMTFLHTILNLYYTILCYIYCTAVLYYTTIVHYNVHWNYNVTVSLWSSNGTKELYFFSNLLYVHVYMCATTLHYFTVSRTTVQVYYIISTTILIIIFNIVWIHI